MHHVELGLAERQNVAVAQRGVDLGSLRNGQAQPGGLYLDVIVEFLVPGVHVDGGAGGRLQLFRSADVIDVRMCDDNGSDAQAVPGEQLLYFADVVAGVDDNRLAAGLVAKDGAVALQHADGQDLMDHSSIVIGAPRILEEWPCFRDWRRELPGERYARIRSPA